MNLIVSMRSKILEGLADALVTNVPELERAIYFYDESGEVELCKVYFYSVETPSTSGGKATYRFYAKDGSTVIRGTVGDNEGTVKSFKISGCVPPSTSPVDDFITGTVGGLTSSADMKFNKTLWQTGMNITISNLYLVMR